MNSGAALHATPFAIGAGEGGREYDTVPEELALVVGDTGIRKHKNRAIDADHTGNRHGATIRTSVCSPEPPCTGLSRRARLSRHSAPSSRGGCAPPAPWPASDGGESTPSCSVPRVRIFMTAGLALLTGCVSYTPQPVDPLAMLRELEQATLPWSEGQQSSSASAAESNADNRLTAREAAGWAVTHNPALVALRADFGIAEAELVRAGLLPDPVVGWDAMNVVAVEWTGGTPTTVDYVAGLGALWQIPRPGEISARVGTALAHREEVQQGILAAEWRLVRAVHEAFVGVVGSRARLDLNTQALEVARRTASFFQKAREVGGATALQESLAAFDLANLEQDRVLLDGELQTARQELNRLLGLPPGTEIEPAIPADPLAMAEINFDVAQLVEQAMRQRPDLRQLLAIYSAAEQDLQLEIALQWPLLAIGTGVSIVLPVFSRLNRPAIQAATARRERIAREVRSAVHAVRAETTSAVTELQNASRQVRAFEGTLIPGVQESLRLTDEAFRAREVTLIEILTAQGQVLDTRRNYLEARIRAARARILVDTVTGNVLADKVGAQEEEKR